MSAITMVNIFHTARRRGERIKPVRNLSEAQCILRAFIDTYNNEGDNVYLNDSNLGEDVFCCSDGIEDVDTERRVSDSAFIEQLIDEIFR